MPRLPPRALIALTLAASACAGAPPSLPPRPAATAALATFTVREHLDHRFEDALLHFDFDVAQPAGDPWLADAAGAPVLSQIEGVTRSGGRLRGRVWTVASLAPHGTIELALRAGGPAQRAAPGAWIAHEGGALVLANDRVAVAIPELVALARPTDLRGLPPPVRAVRVAGGAWLGGAAWVNEGAPLLVEQATTEIVEAGPVRVTVRQRLSFAGGQSYVAVVSLAARQEVAHIIEDADVQAQGAALRLSMEPGLGADHVFWQTQYRASTGAPPWSLMDTHATFDRDRVVSHLRPWSFWWITDVSQWAAFYRETGQPLAGVLLLRPSRWQPDTWDGYERTEIPVTARRGGGLDLTFVLDARRAGHDADAPLHREWALTAGTVAEHVTRDAAHARMRQLLVEQGELPLDEVKDFDLDFTPAPREHPSLIFTRKDMERVRRQATTDPGVKAEVERATTYIMGCGGMDASIAAGPAACFDRYQRNYLRHHLPTAYLGSDDPRWGRLLAGVVEGFTRRIVELFLVAPERPSLGAYGPWFTTNVIDLALALDLLEDTPYLAPEKAAEARSALVLGTHAIASADYWNNKKGLCSANPNMTAAIELPVGVLGVALAGHPDAEGWRRRAEKHLDEGVLASWVSPGGAWTENPSYQLASLDGIMMFVAALRGAGYRDYFADPRLRADLDYFGFVLTAPDRRFAPKTPPGGAAPMILPTIGDAQSGQRSPHNGWMAAGTAGDPAYSARQQFYWRQQSRSTSNAARATGYALAVTDPELPAAPPAETSAGFPGFGSILRSSWTDPRQSYVAHRTGPNEQHYHYDQGSFVYYAKGAPLCLDWGNNFTPRQRAEPRYHNEVIFSIDDAPELIVPRGSLVRMGELPGFLAWSQGTSASYHLQRDDRYLSLVMSADAQGANYLIIRDRTADGAGPTHPFSNNVWVLAFEPEVRGHDVHFPGRMGVDLELSVLSPQAPQIATDHWSWSGEVSDLGQIGEDQWGVHVTKEGSAEDFLTVLYPRASGERAPRVSALAGGAGARVVHSEGVDVLVLSPDRPAWVRDGGAELHGELALARRYDRGALRLVVADHEGGYPPTPGRGPDAFRTSATLDDWGLASDGAVALEIDRGAATGVSHGEAHAVMITLPPRFGAATALVDGSPVAAEREGRRLTLALPAGAHTLAIRGGR